GGGASALGPRRKGPGPPVEAGSALQLKPRLQGRVHSAPKLAATPAVPRSTPLPPPPPPPSAHSSALPRTVVIPGSKGGVAKQRLLPSRAKSQFTWVKGSQGLAPNSAPSPGGACAMPLPTPARRTLRRPGSVAKTTKYTWVSSSSSSSMRLSRKPLSPKALDTPQRAALGGGARKLKSAASHAAKHKKGAGQGAGPAGSSSSPRGPMGQRVIRTRYKIVTRRTGAGPAHTAASSPALTWRAKKLQSARSLLQSRMRPAPDRLPPPALEGAGHALDRGALYRVSANKLCRTTSTGSTGPAPSPGNEQARQKKLQVRQYCMYYNRFGKCNRGNACPYIHDPDKVAVCTRFLRGTCKQTDGSCPFSHKLSKEKMPVCSYFLRGIRSLQLPLQRTPHPCQEGCPPICGTARTSSEPSAPGGEALQSVPVSCGASVILMLAMQLTDEHLCRSDNTSSLCSTCQSTHSFLPVHGRDWSDRPEGAEPAAEEPASSGPEKLPSFISLPSSPEPAEEEEEADTPTAPGSEVTEKKLLISRASENTPRSAGAAGRPAGPGWGGPRTPPEPPTRRIAPLCSVHDVPSEPHLGPFQQSPVSTTHTHTHTLTHTRTHTH
ncbi:hypothetical protein ANANG_G00075620, partial [Anguilla anguilla]